MDERKLWRYAADDAIRAKCSDCAWSYPGLQWHDGSTPPEDVLRFFRAHKCSDHPKSSPWNRVYVERRSPLK